MRNTAWRLVLARVFSLHLPAGCGGDRMERGAAEDPEEGVPSDLKETGVGRWQQEIREKEPKALEQAQERQ